MRRDEAEIAGARAETEQTIEVVAARLTAQRETARRAQQAVRERDALLAAHESAQRDVGMFSHELAAVGSNGYDAEAHTRLSAELVQAAEAAQRCAGLRDAAASLQLVSGRLSEQEEKLAEALAVVHRLAEAAQAVALDPEASRRRRPNASGSTMPSTRRASPCGKLRSRQQPRAAVEEFARV